MDARAMGTGGEALNSDTRIAWGRTGQDMSPVRRPAVAGRRKRNSGDDGDD